MKNIELEEDFGNNNIIDKDTKDYFNKNNCGGNFISWQNFLYIYFKII